MGPPEGGRRRPSGPSAAHGLVDRGGQALLAERGNRAGLRSEVQSRRLEAQSLHGGRGGQDRKAQHHDWYEDSAVHGFILRPFRAWVPRAESSERGARVETLPAGRCVLSVNFCREGWRARCFKAFLHRFLSAPSSAEGRPEATTTSLIARGECFGWETLAAHRTGPFLVLAALLLGLGSLLAVSHGALALPPPEYQIENRTYLPENLHGPVDSAVDFFYRTWRTVESQVVDPAAQSATDAAHAVKDTALPSPPSPFGVLQDQGIWPPSGADSLRPSQVLSPIEAVAKEAGGAAGKQVAGAQEAALLDNSPSAPTAPDVPPFPQLSTEEGLAAVPLPDCASLNSIAETLAQASALMRLGSGGCPARGHIGSFLDGSWTSTTGGSVGRNGGAAVGSGDAGAEVSLPGMHATRQVGDGLVSASAVGPFGLGWLAGIGEGLPLLALLVAFLALPLVVLYRRMARHALLEEATRRAAYEDVIAHPGTTITAAARRIGVERSTLLYHLQRLEESGLLKVERAGNRDVWFACGVAIDEGARRRAVVLSTSRAEVVAEFLAGRPEATSFEVARATGMSASTVRFHRKRLVAVGVVPGAGARTAPVDGRGEMQTVPEARAPTTGSAA